MSASVEYQAEGATVPNTTSTTSPTIPQQEEDDTKYRVKIYEMTDTGNWIDKGTGHVNCTFMQGVGYSLVVRSETDGSCVLNSKILLTEYKMQQDTLLIWHDECGLDLALSFQDQSGCLDIWDQIEEVQRRLAADSHDIDNIAGFHNTQEDDTETAYQLQADFSLPEATVKNLEELEQIFGIAVKSMATRETLLKIVLESDFLETFIELLEKCEDLDMIQECFQMSNIVKCLYYLNNPTLFNLMLQDPYFPILLGMLEYDREYPTTKAYYRDYFVNQVRFKQVVPLINLDLVTQINRVYRANYMKDVALARTIEDSTFSALNTLVYQNQNEIIQTVGKDEGLLHKIITLSHQGNKDANSFLQELLVMVKSFSKDTQMTLYRSLARQGLFDDPIVADDLEVLSCILEHSALPIRKLILAEADPSASLLMRIINRLNDEKEDEGSKIQIFEIFRLLLDTTGVGSAVATPLTADGNDLDHFLTLFYAHFAEPLFSSLHVVESQPISYERENVTAMLLDLLSFFVTQNGMFCKNFLLASSLLKKISLFLLTSSGRKSFVRLAALRVFRICLGMNDEFYRRLLMKQEVLGKIVVCLVETEGKNNLLNSACLDFFSSIVSSDGMKSVIIHIVSQYRSEFKQVQTFVESPIFDRLIQAFDEYESASLQPPKTAAGESTYNVRKDGYEKVDHTEEAYFLKDDDETDEMPQGKKSGGALEFVSGGLLLGTSTQSTTIPHPPQIKLVPYTLDDSDSSGSEDELTIGVKKRSISLFSSAAPGKKIAINLKSTTPTRVEEDEDHGHHGNSAKRRKLI